MKTHGAWLRDQWKRHKAEWSKCTKCRLGEFAKRHCLGRGTLPAAVLFIGEGPGRGEDAIGEPFVGPAGKLLDRWLDAAEIGGPDFPCAITNLVACRPCDGVNEPNRAPLDEETVFCGYRLGEFALMAAPSAVVIVGRKADIPTNGLQSALHWLGAKIYHIEHPASVLRAGGFDTEGSRKAIAQLKAMKVKTKGASNEKGRRQVAR